jgi:5-methylcytosine-specific restriction endonuclease McrA
VPVEVIDEQIAGGAFVKGVVHDGVKVQQVKHVGRYLPAELRTTVELGEAPAFEGLACVDCGRRSGIELDHRDPVANGGATSADNLHPRCWDRHGAKTERDRAAGLLRGRGRRSEEPP